MQFMGGKEIKRHANPPGNAGQEGVIKAHTLDIGPKKPENHVMPL
jgi:hypothetical protein